MRKATLLIMLLAPLSLSAQLTNVWRGISHDDAPWVENVSRPNKITRGLQGHHLALWASHGRYYDQKRGGWHWQRPLLFGTTEDLFTQTIVVPFLIPMLENAGAVVFTPRERDWQVNEVIVDNDDRNASALNYLEVNQRRSWDNAGVRAFAWHKGSYVDGENAFNSGTARVAKATKSKRNYSLISYQPNLPEAGRYAVYVAYKTLRKSVSDAHYTVYHKGIATDIRVNQRMGGGTWVYIGTFDFDEGCNEYNRVVLTNQSGDKGVVTADAVRFGGGMGNIERGGVVSGQPRCLEGARYYAQWAGTPSKYYNTKNGEDDYGDDINVRSLMTNWLAGGSAYVPAKEGLGVPIELSLAVHSDAGVANESNDIIGSLAICTTDFNDGRLNSGVTRMASNVLAADLLDGLMRDLPRKYGKWNKRYLWDRNYSETRLPEVPSAIIETMSHENFADMLLGQDPNFKFDIARSLYKTLTRYVAKQHGEKCVIQPLAPLGFNISLHGDEATLSWRVQEDELEPEASPSSYNVYMAVGAGGFDNGVNVGGTQYKVKLKPGEVHSFRVTACNRGGESFPTEVLSTYYQPGAVKTVLVVNGFNRLSPPAVVGAGKQRSFDLDKDAGVSYGLYAGWQGRGMVMGNTFDYVTAHADAIASSGKYNIVSSSEDAFLNGKVAMRGVDGIDLILGLERYDMNVHKYYKTFTPTMQKLLRSYVGQGGRLLVSGAYIGDDMRTEEEGAFLSEVLRVEHAPCDSLVQGDSISGLGMSFDIYRQLNSRHYAAPHTDALVATAPTTVGMAPFCAMTFDDGESAAVAYRGDNGRTFTMAFPFECIKSQDTRRALMRGIMQFLLE